LDNTLIKNQTIHVARANVIAESKDSGNTNQFFDIYKIYEIFQCLSYHPSIRKYM